ncbi:SAM-dependent methyltransferase [Corynebacterium liangguodongii]|uniref:SAM-dependent methyltransferase n=1 Tax=Corynebacterium liangguodongii TaxID=2079535 RepID=UPI001F2EBF28|nr:class I SAM-dependent methyltransferase [Corynebacterium liangguodongii]
MEPTPPIPQDSLRLAAIDPRAWPGVATVPSGATVRVGARVAEARFASACSRAGIELDPARGAELIVEHDALFRRIAASGWVGLAEGYMAGEWAARDSATLVDALAKLLRADYRPRTPSLSAGAHEGIGEIPPQLAAHFSGDGMSDFAGHFATGVPTTERVVRKRRGAAHAVDLTEFAAPLDVAGGDLADAQRRSVELLLNACAAGRGTQLAEYPSTGGAVAIAAAQRGCVVDSWVRSDAAEAALRDRLGYAGVSGAVHIEREAPRRGGYDAVVSLERLETLGAEGKARYLGALGAALRPGGRIAVQTVTRTEACTVAAQDALQSLRAYIWPGLTLASPGEVERVVEKRTALRIVAQSRAPQHLEASLRLQRQAFDAHLRDAAADGFDAVYRRLWRWQLALREALARLGMVDLMQFTLVAGRG